MTKAGFLGVGVPERDGGSGGTLTDALAKRIVSDIVGFIAQAVALRLGQLDVLVISDGVLPLPGTTWNVTPPPG